MRTSPSARFALWGKSGPSGTAASVRFRPSGLLVGLLHPPHLVVGRKGSVERERGVVGIRIGESRAMRRMHATLGVIDLVLHGIGTGGELIEGRLLAVGAWLVGHGIRG